MRIVKTQAVHVKLKGKKRLIRYLHTFPVKCLLDIIKGIVTGVQIDKTKQEDTMDIEQKPANEAAEETLSQCTEAELLGMYEEADEDSTEFEQIAAELEKRGYSFEAPENVPGMPTAPILDTSTELNLPKRAVKLTYSRVGSLVWEIIFTLLGVGGALWFFSKMEESGAEPNFRATAMVFIGAMMVVSIGAIVGGVRRLANQKEQALQKANAAFFGYYVLLAGWFLCFAACIYTAVDIFIKVVEYSFKYALLGSLAPLLAALFCSAFFSIFYVLGKELRD